MVLYTESGDTRGICNIRPLRNQAAIWRRLAPYQGHNHRGKLDGGADIDDK